MSTLADKLTMCADGTEAPLYVDDVFSTYLYTGNGSTQTIKNGIDLASEGGMVWLKERSALGGSHVLFDTARNNSSKLDTSSTIAESGQSVSWSYLSNGFSFNTAALTYNANAATYASWTFRRAPKFFDVVTYTGNGVAGRQIAHSLGVAPGMIVVKKTSAAGDWQVWHRSTAVSYNLTLLNSTAATVNTGFDNAAFQQFNGDASTFTLGAGTRLDNTNQSGATYVAYLFAHDTAEDDGIIQCGSYTGNGSANGPEIDLGWEPQYVLIKGANTSSAVPWMIFDSMRGLAVDGSGTQRLLANDSAAETSAGGQSIRPLSTGFQPNATSSYVNESGKTFIYLAIRRPNKPPTVGTQVFQAYAETDTATQTVGWPVDVFWDARRSGNALNTIVMSRLTGNALSLTTSSTRAEDGSAGSSGAAFEGMTTFRPGIGFNWWCAFRRAPGFFDVVCYTGVVSTVNHNLGVVPELIIVKSRFTIGSWMVDHKDFGTGMYAFFNTSGAEIGPDSTIWNSTKPTSTVFSTGTSALTNGSGRTYVAYLFATLPGISKVDSYIGNGSNQIINCGFAAGARFILIKRTDLTGDWYVWDTTRGIVAANDPHLSLNTAIAEATNDDSIDPASSGFIVNQVAATNINVLNGNYIFLAIA